MTELLVWLDEPAEGHANMAADEVLAGEAVRQNRPLVRFYRWSQMTVSLGAFQPIATAEAEPAIASLPLVRRPSGGGAIVHGSDLTCAVAVPRDHPWGDRPQVLYDAFHQSLVDVLGSRGIVARLHPGRGLQENDEGRLLCFDRRARGDLVVSGPSPDGHKLLGSAQRRLKAAVLQGSSLASLAAPSRRLTRTRSRPQQDASRTPPGSAVVDGRAEPMGTHGRDRLGTLVVSSHRSIPFAAIASHCPPPVSDHGHETHRRLRQECRP